MNNINILIVEDEIIVAEDLMRGLHYLGYKTVDTVSNGNDAINYVKTNRPDIILMDIVIKGRINGIETARKINKIANIPIIYCTGNNTKNYFDKMKDTTPYGIMTKPYSINDVKQNIEMANSKYQQSQKIEHLNRILQLIRKVTQLIIKERDKKKLLKKICKTFVKIRDFNSCWIALFDDNKNLSYFTQSGLDKEFQDLKQSLLKGNFPKCVEKSFLQTEVISIKNTVKECNNCPLFGKNPEFKAMTVCLRYEDRNYGVISIEYSNKFVLDNEEKTLFNEVANDIGFSIHNFEIEEKQNKTLEALSKSEEKYKDLYNNAPLCYQSLDKNGFILDVNPEWCNTLGYTRDEIIGEWFGNFLDRDDVNHFKKEFNKLKKDGFCNNIQFKMITKKDKYLYVSFQSRVGYTDKNNFDKTYSTFKDITEQKIIEEELNAANQQMKANYEELVRNEQYLRDNDLNLRTILNSIHDAVIATNNMGFIVDMNPNAEQLSGWSLEESKGKTFPEVFNIIDSITKKQIENPIVDVLKTGSITEVAHKQNILISKKGNECFISESGAYIRDENDFITGVVIVIRDITLRYKMRNSIRRKTEKYHILFNNMTTGFAFHKIILDDKNNPVDYIFEEVNNAFEEQTGLVKNNIIGKKITEIMPGIEKDTGNWIEKYGKVVQTGESITFEQFSKPLSKWFHIYAYSPKKGYFATIFSDITDRKNTEIEKDKLLHDINERYKELTILYEVSKIISDSNIPLNEILHTIANLIPSAWHYPDFTCARIVYDNEQYKSDKFKFTKWKQSQNIIIKGKIVGNIDVYFLKEMPELFEGPFLEEERNLINILCNQISQIINNKNSESELNRTHNIYHQTIENANGVSYKLFYKDKTYDFISTSCKKLLGISHKDITFAKIRNLIINATVADPQKTTDYSEYNKMFLAGKLDKYWVDLHIKTPEGKEKWISDRSLPIKSTKTGEIIGSMGILQDTSERKKMETHLRQSQKMEAMGTLAGGIAHDFNNILQIIFGYLSVAKIQVEEDKELTSYLDFIEMASNRAMDLVSQILTFSRQSEEKKYSISPSSLLKEELKLIRSTIPPNIKIIKKIDSNCGNIYFNPNQFHQIVMNLCTNAYHAMEEEGGLLEVELKKINIKLDFVSQFSKIKKGKYIRLSIQDNGVGISNENIDRIFEPFFTTKEVGEGTGLGLSTILGLISNISGGVEIDSKIGIGTKIHIYFPIHDNTVEINEVKPESKNLKGTGNILLIDDEETILEITKCGLTDAGYTVDIYSDAKMGLESFLNNPHKYDVILLDYLMPNIRGDEIINKIRKINKDIPILLYTGYDGKIEDKYLKKTSITQIVKKPVELYKLIEFIKDAIEIKKTIN